MWQCTICGEDLGESNPRQYCCKTYCRRADTIEYETISADILEEGDLFVVALENEVFTDDVIKMRNVYKVLSITKKSGICSIVCSSDSKQCIRTFNSFDLVYRRVLF